MCGSPFKHLRIEADVLGLALIVELLAQARADLLRDFARVDGAVESPVDAKEEFELAEIGLDR